MSTFRKTVSAELGKIPPAKRRNKLKGTLIGVAMLVAAVAFKALGWWELLQIPLFVIGGFLLAGDYVRVAVRGIKETLKIWKNGS